MTARARSHKKDCADVSFQHIGRHIVALGTTLNRLSSNWTFLRFLFFFIFWLVFRYTRSVDSLSMASFDCLAQNYVEMQLFPIHFNSCCFAISSILHFFLSASHRLNWNRIVNICGCRCWWVVIGGRQFTNCLNKFPIKRQKPKLLLDAFCKRHGTATQ